MANRITVRKKEVFTAWRWRADPKWRERSGPDEYGVLQTTNTIGKIYRKNNITLTVCDGDWVIEEDGRVKTTYDDVMFKRTFVEVEGDRSPIEFLTEYDRAKKQFIEFQRQGLLQEMCIFAKQAFKLGVSKDQIHGDIREALIEAWGEQCPKN